MNSRLLRTFGLMVVIMSLITASLSASEPILIGKGVDAKWSPKGGQISYLRYDSLIITNVDDFSGERFLRKGAVHNYDWLNDSTIYVHYRNFLDDSGKDVIQEGIQRPTLDGQVVEVASDSFVVGTGPNKGIGLKKLPNGAISILSDSTGDMSRSVGLMRESRSAPLKSRQI